MSYTVVTSFTFNKDFTELKGKCYSNNVYPHTPHDFSVKCENKTPKEFLKEIIEDIIGGGIQFASKNYAIKSYIDFVLDMYNKESIRTLWISEYDFNYNYKTKSFESQEDEKAFENATKEKEEIIETIANAYMNKMFDKEIKELKSKVYIITNGSTHIVQILKRGYRYSSDISKAKQFNYFEKRQISNYYRENFKILELKEAIELTKNVHIESFKKSYENLLEIYKTDNKPVLLSLEQFIEKRKQDFQIFSM